MNGRSTKEREHRAFAVHELKAMDDNAGLFEGYVAVFSNLDGNGDVIDRGAFTKTIREAREVKERDKTPYILPLLWQHQEKDPIGGIIDAHEDDHGLYIRGQYDLDIEQGRRAYSGAKKGYLRGLSIGYDPVKSVWDQKHIRHLTEIRLWEGSPVTFPANVLAGITQVKNGTGPQESKRVTGKGSWPLADEGHAWDSGAAHKRLLDWAGGDGSDFSASKFASVHFWSPDSSQEDDVSEYKFPFCDVIGGEVKAVPRAIYAGAADLSKAQGVDKSGIQSKLGHYYERMRSEFKDDSIVAPWEKKERQTALVRELKAQGGLQVITSAAQYLDDMSDSEESLVEALANACGYSLDGDDAGDTQVSPQVAALLGGIDGLEPAIKAVIMAWQEWANQCDALLQVLGIPDNDDMYESSGYGMMGDVRSALLELKAGRKISATTRKQLMGVVDGVMGHMETIKSIVGQGPDMMEDDDESASGMPDGKSLERGTGQKPGNRTTSSSSTMEPDPSTLSELEAMLLVQQIDLMNH